MQAGRTVPLLKAQELGAGCAIQPAVWDQRKRHGRGTQRPAPQAGAAAIWRPQLASRQLGQRRQHLVQLLRRRGTYRHDRPHLGSRSREGRRLAPALMLNQARPAPSPHSSLQRGGRSSPAAAAQASVRGCALPSSRALLPHLVCAVRPCKGVGGDGLCARCCLLGQHVLLGGDCHHLGGRGRGAGGGKAAVGEGAGGQLHGWRCTVAGGRAPCKCRGPRLGTPQCPRTQPSAPPHRLRKPRPCPAPTHLDAAAALLPGPQVGVAPLVLLLEQAQHSARALLSQLPWRLRRRQAGRQQAQPAGCPLLSVDGGRAIMGSWQSHIDTVPESSAGDCWC